MYRRDMVSAHSRSAAARAALIRTVPSWSTIGVSSFKMLNVLKPVGSVAPAGDAAIIAIATATTNMIFSITAVLLCDGPNGSTMLLSSVTGRYVRHSRLIIGNPSNGLLIENERPHHMTLSR